MAAVNAKVVRQIPRRFLADGKRGEADLQTLLSLVQTASSARSTGSEWLSFVSTAAGEAAAAGQRVATALTTHADPGNSSLTSWDRCRALIYVSSLSAYFEELATGAGDLSEEQFAPGDSGESTKTEQFLKRETAERLVEVEEATISVKVGVRPLLSDSPLLKALGQWLITAMRRHGIGHIQATKFSTEQGGRAVARFDQYLRSRASVSAWLAGYLCWAGGGTGAKSLADLGSVHLPLEGWLGGLETTPGSVGSNKEDSWRGYREALKVLPDDKESMFNEQFGVRRVFVKPGGAYRVTGAEGTAGKPTEIADLGLLLGALISTRLPGDDLIILSGGPGSGKSTLCRLLASELAKDPRIHPIWVRLRRAKEVEITAFLEETLQRAGVIDRISDLRSFPNVVLILDGFDELVMASRARLRHFFNVLLEEHSTGPLRNAKIIVSGRDTLFPGGEGLPIGSHVVSLVPFDETRIRQWAANWRRQQPSGRAARFDPLNLVHDKGDLPSSPLWHLISWPLTLHLVARAQMAGLLNGSSGTVSEVQKAYLYRSIVTETATRQMDQAAGAGRLDPSQMRDFIRELAWTMYSSATDSLDSPDVIPLLGRFFPKATDTELAELADVAVVNCPQLEKGEETGFEFVHKSFSEYLVAERVADQVERVIYKTDEYGTSELTWRMDEDGALRVLTPILASRLLTEEVQEMLEPMLGSFQRFLAGRTISDVVSVDERRPGLERVITRFEDMYTHSLHGRAVTAMAEAARGNPLVGSPLEAAANYLAGCILIGTAAVRQWGGNNEDSAERHFFSAEPFDGAFWRCVSVLQSGGLTFDAKLTRRLFLGSTVRSTKGSKLNDIGMPWKVAFFAEVDGFEPRLSEAAAAWFEHTELTDTSLAVALVILARLVDASPDMVDYLLRYQMRDSDVSSWAGAFIEAGLVDFRVTEDRHLRAPQVAERLIWEFGRRSPIDYQGILSSYLWYLESRLPQIPRSLMMFTEVLRAVALAEQDRANENQSGRQIRR